ncbi:hypothetical protein LCGC14_0879260 [marine sediment metagenome]|uniref:Uncharacterized protein n=1 Tax=marine sediment metagenome TaxID=412755 RepID=A0A0F9S9E7_9ZZZZ
MENWFWIIVGVTSWFLIFTVVDADVGLVVHDRRCAYSYQDAVKKFTKDKQSATSFIARRLNYHHDEFKGKLTLHYEGYKFKYVLSNLNMKEFIKSHWVYDGGYAPNAYQKVKLWFLCALLKPLLGISLIVKPGEK